MASSTEIWSLETAYNELLRKIWNLPYRCRTAISYRVAGVSSIYSGVGNEEAPGAGAHPPPPPPPMFLALLVQGILGWLADELLNSVPRMRKYCFEIQIYAFVWR